MFWQIVCCYLVSCIPATILIGLMGEVYDVSTQEILSMGITWPIWVVRRIVIVAIDKFKGE